MIPQRGRRGHALTAKISRLLLESQRRKLTGKQEAHVIAVACSPTPEGQARWTLRLLAAQVVELGFADTISRETVRQILKKTNSSLGRKSNGASPQ